MTDDERISLTLVGGRCKAHKQPCYIAVRYPKEVVDGVRTYYGHVQRVTSVNYGRGRKMRPNGWLSIPPGTHNRFGHPILHRTRWEAKLRLAVPEFRTP